MGTRYTPALSSSVIETFADVPPVASFATILVWYRAKAPQHIPAHG
ncbi:MAG: hypothetical protein AAF982_00595 [Pseudomonadota bacterium]